MFAKRFAFPIFLAGSAILSAGPLFVRLADVGAVQSAFWRLAIGAPFVLMLALLIPDTQTAEGGARPRPATWGLLVVAGAFFALDVATWHLGIKRTTMANSALLANAASFFFPIWGYVVARSWPTRRAAVAMFVALAGAILLMGLSAQLGTRYLAGDLLCLVAAAAYTVYLIIMEKARASLGVWPALAVATAISAITLLPVALFTSGVFWPHDWTPLLALALGSQVLGQGLTVMTLPHLSAVSVGVGLLIQPILTTLIGIGYFHERLGPLQLLGMALILVALVLVRVPNARGKVPSPQE